MLARLRRNDAPEPVQTSLHVQEEPLADISRYDRLHQESHGDIRYVQVARRVYRQSILFIPA